MLQNALIGAALRLLGDTVSEAQGRFGVSHRSPWGLVIPIFPALRGRRTPARFLRAPGHRLSRTNRTY